MRSSDVLAVISLTSTAFLQKYRALIVTVADVLGVAAIVMVVFLTTLSSASTARQTAAVAGTAALGRHQYDY